MGLCAMKLKKKSGGSAINTEGWMMSYADMATTLLAMFIVLSTLGKDQTGISLYNGTGSFIHAMESFGLPGLFSTSSRAFQLDAGSPHYLSPGPLDPSEQHPGPDAGQPNDRVIDGEQEQLQRFLGEMQRQLQVQKLARPAGQAVVDFYDPLTRRAPYLSPRELEVARQVVPLLHRSDYRVSVVVWATTPSASAWNRAAGEAKLVADDLASSAQLDGDARARLLPLGQTWPYAKIRRPILSLVIAKTGTPG
jgi:hypothetical protein